MAFQKNLVKSSFRWVRIKVFSEVHLIQCFFTINLPDYWMKLKPQHIRAHIDLIYL